MGVGSMTFVMIARGIAFKGTSRLDLQESFKRAVLHRVLQSNGQKQLNLSETVFPSESVGTHEKQ